jgi:hypothetical protein
MMTGKTKSKIRRHAVLMEILSCFGNRRLLPEKNTTANGHKIYPRPRNCERAGRKSAAAEKAICLSQASNGADDGQCSLFKGSAGGFRKHFADGMKWDGK